VERRRAAKLLEDRKRRTAELATETTTLAAAHFDRALLRRCGVAPWFAFITLLHASAACAAAHSDLSYTRRAVHTWVAAVNATLAAERERHTAAAAPLKAAHRSWVLRKVVKAWAGYVTAAVAADTTLVNQAWCGWGAAVQASVGPGQTFPSFLTRHHPRLRPSFTESNSIL